MNITFLRKTTSVLLSFVLIVGMFASLPASTAQAATVFSDGFETNNFSNWTSSEGIWSVQNGGADTGSKKAEAKGDSGQNPDVLQKNISTLGNASIQLAYRYKIAAGFESSDHVYVEWSTNGTTWNLLTDYTNLNTTNNYATSSFNLPAGAANNAGFRFRFRADLDSNGDQFWLDTVTLSGTPIDSSVPTVTIVQAATQTDPTTVSPINFTVQFSESVTDFNDASDVTLSGTAGATTIAITPIDVDGDTYTVAVSGMTTTGEVTVLVPTGAATDGSNLSAASPPTGDRTVTFQIDVCPNDAGTQTSLEQCTPQKAAVHIDKVVCDSESDLPNWGDGGPNITSTTASSYVSDSDGNCELADWEFQWAPEGTANPGDNVEEAGGAWTTFSSLAEFTNPLNALFWFREVRPAGEGWLPFSTDTSAPYDEYSAEFYCNTDVVNYDNYDFIDDVDAGETFYCVAFNTKAPQCSDGIDNADTEDTDIDENDRGCWTDPNNPDTYNPNDTDETTPADVCPNDSGIQTSIDQCVPTPPSTGAVTICKLDETGNTALSGWTVKLSQDETDTFSGVTVHNPGQNDHGCITFSPVPFGSYIISEVLQPGWENVSLEITGAFMDGDMVVVNDDRETFYLANDQLPQCSNGLDDDMDELTDENDPDCLSGEGGAYDPEDNDEDAIPEVFQCSDELDNDGDGLIDFAVEEGDPDCTSSEDNDEFGEPSGGGEGTLTVIKQVTGVSEEESSYEFDFDINGAGQFYDLDVTVNGVEGDESLVLAEGSYDVFENVPDGWSLVSVSCVYDEQSAGTSIENGKEITIYDGAEITCTFVNEKQPEVVDMCSNIEGVQTEVPEGRHADGHGNCNKDRSNGNHRGSVSGGGQVLGATTSCEPLLSDYLKMGWANNADQVQKLQKFLNELLGTSVEESGVFDLATEDAVKTFQKTYWQKVLQPWFSLPGSGIQNQEDPTGFVYITTLWQINDLVCPDQVPFPSQLD